MREGLLLLRGDGVMELRHYAPDTVLLDRSRTYKQERPDSYTKPVGLWISVKGENDWLQWCTDELFRLDHLAVEHHVTLGGDILILDKSDDLLDFQSTYGIRDRRGYAIDWPRVTQDYDGVIIAPYHWQHRLSLSWYYTWDCASGCIWNLNAIEKWESHR